MKRIGSLVLIVLFCILVCGCISQPSTSQTQNLPANSTPGPATTEAHTQKITDSVIAMLDSSHPNTTFSLDPGVYVISFQAQDALKVDFILSPIGTNDSNATLESFKTTGPFNGSVAVVISEKGEYQLKTLKDPLLPSGEGIWTTEISPLPLDNPLEAPLYFTGVGKKVTPVFYLDKGEYIFERNEILLDSPLFNLQFANGTILRDQNENPQPDFGFESSKLSTIVTIPESGTYFLMAYTSENPHNWSASIVSLPKTPPS